MKVRIFDGQNTGSLENDINYFLSIRNISIKYVTQSCSQYGYRTISIFYEEVENNASNNM